MMQNCDIFLILVKNIEYGYTLEPVPSIYVLEQKIENNVYPCKPQFYLYKSKWGVRGSSLHGHVSMVK